MANEALYQLLAGGGSLANEQDYYNQNPYFQAGASLAKTPMPVARTNAEALILPTLQGLLTGGLLGYGRRDATQEAYSDYRQNPLLRDYTQVGNVGPVASGDEYAKLITGDQAGTMPYSGMDMPEGWTQKQGKADLIQAALLDQVKKEEAQKKQSIQDQLEADITKIIDPRVREAKVSDEMALIEARQKVDRTTKSKDTSIAAQSGIESLDRLLSMSKNLPDSMAIRELKSHSPLTNEVNFFDAQTTAVANALAKQLEGRVNETVLATYKESIARHAGDTKQDIANRLVNAQLWLTRIAQGDTKAMNLDAAEFAKSRGVDPKAIGVDFGGEPASIESPPTPPAGFELTGKKDASGNWGIRKIK